jgi:hypothetical protein
MSKIMYFVAIMKTPEFLEAENKVEIKKEHYDSCSYLQPVIKIFDKEIELYLDDKFKKLTEQEQLQQELRKSKIYKLATQNAVKN